MGWRGAGVRQLLVAWRVLGMAKFLALFFPPPVTEMHCVIMIVPIRVQVGVHVVVCLAVLGWRGGGVVLYFGKCGHGTAGGASLRF